MLMLVTTRILYASYAIDIPTDTLLCRADCAVDHAARLERYYSDIKCCLLVWYTRVKRPTRHSIGHFGDGGPEQ